jgi:hypothetical protein
MRGTPCTPDLQPDLIGTAGHVDGMDGAALGRAGQAIASRATNIVSLAGFAAEPAYQVSFSQHYRQQVLAHF